MRKRAFLLMLTLCLVCAAPARAVTIQSTTTLTYPEGHNTLRYLAEHPDVSIEKTSWDYDTTLDLASRMTTRTFDTDIYFLDYGSINRETMMSKGFCLDMSGSEILMGMVSRMYPPIAEQIMFDGCLYAWPTDMTFTYMRIDPAAWEAAGLAQADIPDTFPAFLDFVECWCDRLEDDPEQDIHIMGGMDGYDEMFAERREALYVDWLLELLIRQVVTQQQYAGEALRFDDVDVQNLIRRCDAVGRRIYRAEWANDMGNKGFFIAQDLWRWPDTTDGMVYLRLNEEQPKLIEAKLSTYAINPATAYPELCIELMEAYALSPAGEEPYDLYFFADGEPSLHSWYEADRAEYQAQAESLRLKLEDAALSGDDRMALEDELAFWEDALARIEDRKWVLKPAALADYRAHVDQLYFPQPSVLTELDAGGQIFKLRGQVSSGAISVDQFIQRLCEITSMIQQEQ